MKFMKRIAQSVRHRLLPDEHVASSQAIRRFKADPENTFLVSFPRTGSHWLRMMMELYFGRPSLVRIFYFPERTDYLTYHTHDLDLDVSCRRVIYLYRDPVETIFSQLRYHQEAPDDRQRVVYWSDLYGRHLDKWLHQETFTRQKTILRYDRLKDNLPAEFGKVCAHFGLPVDEARLQWVAEQVSKDHVAQKTTHDPRVIARSQNYAAERQAFREQQGELVWRTLLTGRPHLKHDF